jgi:hypothetical protein
LSGEYVNFASDDDASPVQGYGLNTGRLIEAKRRYDPHNLFCLNANVDPEVTPRA